MKTVIIIKRYDFQDDEDLTSMNVEAYKPDFKLVAIQENRSWYKTTLDIVIDLFFARLFKEKH